MVSAFASVPSVLANASEGKLYYGCGSLVVDLDPQQAWDSASIDVIDQVCEGLLGYDLSDPELAIVPVLATALGTWNADATNYTLTLRQGVTFHDGTAFTADDVVWTFDRLERLIDADKSQIAELYEPLAAQYKDTPLVINQTVKIDDYTVCFVLNYPYVPFEPLLCFSGSDILSETSTPANDLLNIASDTLVGTGPYTYVEQTEEYTDLVAYADWWGTRPTDYINEIVMLLYNDGTAMNQAFLAGQLDWVDGVLPEFLEQFEASDIHHVGEQRQGTTILYMGMNNKQIPLEIRQAISFAFDYDYVIEELAQGNAARLTSPVPEGIMYHNPDLDYPTTNVTHARQILIDNGYFTGDMLTYAEGNITDDDWWIALTYETPVATYNYTWNTGNEFRADLGILTRSNLELIGIHVLLTGMPWANYLSRLLGDFDKLQLYMIGWGPDYNDPSNFINPLFSNTSASNGAQVNDPALQDMMAAGLSETNATARRQIYYDIQAYIVEDLMPWVFLYVPLGRTVWSIEVAGIQRNPMGKLDFWDMYWSGETATTGGATDDDNGPSIPGYSFIGLLGAAAIGLGVILYRKRK